MDIQTSLIYAGVVVLSAAVIFVISMFGIKEKTYEEAIAEQRNMPEENLLIGHSNKDKPKDKKQKKTGKKVKEKPTEREKKQSEVVSSAPAQPVSQEKCHVDFGEPEAEVLSERSPQEDKKKKKKEKVKPILLNKDEQSQIVEVAPVPANHFEEIQPKDDLLLKQKGNKDDLVGKGDKAIVEKMVEPLTVPDKGPAKQPIAKVEKKPEKVTATVIQQEQATPPQPSKERNKKKRSELATLQQMSGDREGVNVSLLMPLVGKAELSWSEIQILIDLLLNKQQGSAVDNSEWIEGRQDPVVKLKKQLAEKEKALQEEQEAGQSLQSKLKELRSELNSERSRLTHSCRQLEESLVTKQNEIQSLAARLQHALESHVAEKQALTQQYQQLQAQMSEDHLLLRKLQEEEGQAQGVLEQELHNQRQQLELHIAHLNETHQEAEAAFNSQIGQLHGKLQEQENISASLRADLQKLREGQMGREGENKVLREQISHLENQIRHLESQAAHLKESSDRAQEFVRQNEEELCRKDAELEHHIASARQREAEVQYESASLLKEVETLKEKCASYNEAKIEVSRLISENEHLLAQVSTMKDLHLEVQHLQEENEHLLSQMSSFSQLEEEAQQLREENESLAAQVTAMTERPAAEGRENGDVQYPEEKRAAAEDDMSQQASIVEQKDLLLEKLSDELKQKDSLVEKLNSEINTYKTEISKLNEDLEFQRRKNNEISKTVRTEEQTATKEILQRIFPDIRIEDNEAYDVWVERFESSVKSFISEQKAQNAAGSVPEDHASMLIELEKQNSQLQAMVTHYKTIIEDTEALLNQLQNRVEKEEGRWRQQLQIKEAELETIKEENNQLQQSLEQLQRTEEMQSKLQDLQENLQTEEAEKRELVHKYEEIQNRCDQLQDQVNSNREQQHEGKEKDCLALELKTEQEKNQDLMKEIVKLRSLVRIGQDSLIQEQQLVQQLQKQLDNLHGMNQNHNVATNGPAPEPSITESLFTSPQPLSETSLLEKRPKTKKKKGGSGKK
ncbi:hypothetical protein B7P43_G01640 [Cryptotermes secundus]|uniref:Ribosome receptor lysine/proline rich domain-containing protein n=1 Tax=Cryptotermes secundus TaxID=105785 RepID=A0A2J7PR36_9NEOP|nr:hypothetical protein B7P43_G01640 [Cryptotermes secundus]